MKKTYISPKSRLMSTEPETMIAASADNPTIDDTNDAVVDPGSGKVIMEGREVIRSRSAWDDEW